MAVCSRKIFAMILKHITVQNLGNVDFFEQDFTGGLNLVRSRHTEELSYAIRLVLNHKIPPLPRSRAEGESCIEAVVEIPPQTFRLMITGEKDPCLHAYDARGNDVTDEYQYLTAHCAEQDLSDVFSGVARTCVLGPLRYLHEDRYYRARELSDRTGGLSDIQAFRAYLEAFIKHFQPELIREGKRYELCLDDGWTYVVRYRDERGDPVLLSDSEQRLFGYLCFLKTAEFWDGFEALRNLHGIKKPLLVEHFLERLDEAIDPRELWDRTLKLNRQIIVLTH